MAVTLSLFAGAGAQFFDNNGNLLIGGKIYTYFAGTTAPQATYTTASVSAFHTNPIILDSAGRVPSGGEIWLNSGAGYKFVVKTSAEVLIATYDNIPSSAQPPAANDADSIMYEQGYTVTAGSFVAGKIYRITFVGTTDFTLIGSVNNTNGTHFIATGAGAGTGTAELSQTVETKLRQIVSAMDFGAVGDGVIDDTSAIQAAIDTVNAAGGGVVTFPAGTYACANLWPKDNVTLQGEGPNASKLINNSSEYSIITTWRLAPKSNSAAINAYVATAPRTTNFNVDGLLLNGQYNVHPDNGDDNHQHGVYLFKTTDCSVTNCNIKEIWYVGVESYYDCFNNNIINNTFIDVGNKPTIVAPTGFYYGVGIDNGATNCKVINNYFNDCGHAINSIVDFFAGVDCVIENNTFGTLEGLFLTHRNGGVRLIVRNNSGDTCGSSLISISADAGNQLGGGYCTNPTVTGNSCNNFNTLNGASVAGIVITANGHKIVSNNRVVHAVTGASRGCIGINMNGPAPSGTCTSQVENNYLDGNFPNYQAIRFNAETNFIERNNSINGQTTGAGVFVASNCSNGEVCIGTQFINVSAAIVNQSTTTKVYKILQSYTPVITASGGGFLLGNGSISGEFVYLGNQLIEVFNVVTIGTTTNLGSGALLITLPKNTNGSEQIGSFALLSNGALPLAGICRARSDHNVDLFAPSQVSGSSPVAIAAGAVIRCSLIYKTQT